MWISSERYQELLHAEAKALALETTIRVHEDWAAARQSQIADLESALQRGERHIERLQKIEDGLIDRLCEKNGAPHLGINLRAPAPENGNSQPLPELEGDELFMQTPAAALYQTPHEIRKAALAEHLSKQPKVAPLEVEQPEDDA